MINFPRPRDFLLSLLAQSRANLEVISSHQAGIEEVILYLQNYSVTCL